MNVGVWLWRLVYGELLGLKTALWLSEQDIFTVPEQLAFKAIARDEARHAEIAMRAARSYMPEPKQTPVITRIDITPINALRQLAHSEGLFVRKYHSWLRPHLSPEFQAQFDTVYADELRHCKVGRNVLARLKPGHKKVFTKNSPWRVPENE